MKHKTWKTLSRTRVLDQMPYLRVDNHVVKFPDGTLIRDWAWITTPDFVNVVAVTKSGKFICFRQRKYALKGVSLAVIGGFIEKGEKPVEAARRELLEETGYIASRWINLGSYCVDPNRGIATASFFLALGAKKAAEPAGGDLEQQELIYLSRRRIEKALDKGEFKVLAWTAILSLSLRCLDGLAVRRDSKPRR